MMAVSGGKNLHFVETAQLLFLRKIALLNVDLLKQRKAVLETSKSVL